MHIAVCDDNIADRKQMERLLSRASEKNKKNGIEGYYIDLYGNVPALMRFPQMYDAIFIDMVNGEDNGLDIARKLRNLGVVCTIVLCKSVWDYQELATDSEQNDFRFMNKPIIVSELNDMLTYCEEHRAVKEPLVELRSKEGTVYAKSSEIINISVNKSYLEVKLLNGNTAQILDTLANFYDQLLDFNCFFPLNDKALCNIYYVDSISFMSVKMKNGDSFMLSPRFANDIRKALQKIK